MSKLMWILGILLTVAGLALGLMIFASPVSVVNWGGGITLEVAAVLLVGGILAIGLGGVVNAISNMPAPKVEMPAFVPPAADPASPIPEFGRRATESTATVAAVATVAEEEVSEPVKETIAALEQARHKIEQAFDPASAETEKPPVADPAPAPTAEPAPQATPEPEPDPETEAETESAAEEDEDGPDETAEGEDLEEGQLYVVEERFIRARPARILSDGTVEAETDEGWMRFENLEHLDEYLDAMAPPARP